MRVPIPHQLGKEEAKRRLKARSHEAAGLIPGGRGRGGGLARRGPHDDGDHGHGPKHQHGDRR